MSDILQLDGPVPAWFTIDDTAHGLACTYCSAGARVAAFSVKTSGGRGGSFESRDHDGLVHFAAVTRLS